jgi:hypothetical protein
MDEMKITDVVKYPVRFVEGTDGIIMDSKNSHVCDIRMWGELTTSLAKENPDQAQDFISRFIADAINEKLLRTDHDTDQLPTMIISQSN